MHILHFVLISPDSKQNMTDDFYPASHLLVTCVTCTAYTFAYEISRRLWQACEMYERISPWEAEDLCPSLVCCQEMVALCFPGQE